MIAPRRFLPSVSSLLALEAVDRLGSATLAAGAVVATDPSSGLRRSNVAPPVACRRSPLISMEMAVMDESS